MKNFSRQGRSLAGINTLNEKRRTPTPHPNTRGALTTTTSRGENVTYLARHTFDFQEPDAKRRKMDHTQSSKQKPGSPSVIDLDGEDDHAQQKSTDRASRTKRQNPLRIPPPITGVQESRNVDRTMSSFQASHNVGSQRPKNRHSRGQTQDQPVELDDDLQISNAQASNGPTDTMTALDNNLIRDLKQVNSKNKRRPDSTATTSHHFADLKRPKMAMADFVGTSDDELEEVAPPLMNGAKRNGRVAAGPESLRDTFKRDDRVLRLNRSPFNQNEEDENMADELGETPEKLKKPSGPSKPTDKTPSKSESFEIAETPSPKDDYMSQADIPPTPFHHVGKGSVTKGKVAKKQSSKAHEEETYPLISYKDGRHDIPEYQHGSQLRFADDKSGFELSFGDDDVIAAINHAKVKALQWSPDGCNLVRVQGVREPPNQLIWDLKFRNIADVKKFVLRLKELARITPHRRSW